MNINRFVKIIDKRYTLMFNIWNVKPTDIHYYDSIKIEQQKYNKTDIIFEIEENHKKIYNINSEKLNIDFYKMILFKKVNINFFINNFFDKNNIILKKNEDLIEFNNLTLPGICDTDNIIQINNSVEI